MPKAAGGAAASALAPDRLPAPRRTAAATIARSGRWLSTSTRFQHRLLAEPGPDAVGKQREVVVRRPVSPARSACAASRRRGGQHARGGRDRNRSRRRCRLRAPPAFHGTACWMSARLAQRPRRADRDAADRAVDPEQQQLQRPRALAAPFEIALQAARPASPPAPRCRRSCDDRLGEMPLDRKRRHRQARRDRLLDPAQRLVEPEQRAPCRSGGRAARAAPP